LTLTSSLVNNTTEDIFQAFPGQPSDLQSFNQPALTSPELRSSVISAKSAECLHSLSTSDQPARGVEPFDNQNEFGHCLALGQQNAESSSVPSVPEYDVIGLLMRGDGIASDTRKRHIFEDNISLLDVLKAGLKALSNNNSLEELQANGSGEYAATPKLLVEPTAACESPSVTYVSSCGLSPTAPAPNYLLESSLYQQYNRTLRDPRNLPCITG